MRNRPDQSVASGSGASLATVPVTGLLAVAVVLGLGAFNWRKQKGKLGTLEGAMALRGSANRELLAAGIVLAITAILVSLPSPKLPG